MKNDFQARTITFAKMFEIKTLIYGKLKVLKRKREERIQKNHDWTNGLSK